MGFLDRFRQKKEHAKTATALYLATVDQSRSPAFYVELGVPDTVDGRFDMIVLHIMLLIRRLRAGDAETQDVRQELLNLMFADMDRNFREMGISDISIGKHVKKAARAFYGRAESLETGLEAGEDDLVQALKETVFRSVEATDPQLRQMGSYVLAADSQLQSMSVPAILGAEGLFPDAPAAIKA